KDKKRRTIFAHFGPVLAGGRLVIASSDGLIRSIDPASGAVISTLEMAGGAASAPVVAGRTLYVVTQNGQLHAFR
ncbi:MAG: PQQ-binding-like beta-propeller repeat protein, partial [Paracoccaceae bacterium]|nr:PQQ-binding-like beta-propeller repeat protein [Paracoccaceae bacterium]